jgi:hypothetical protein
VPTLAGGANCIRPPHLVQHFVARGFSLPFGKLISDSARTLRLCNLAAAVSRQEIARVSASPEGGVATCVLHQYSGVVT